MSLTIFSRELFGVFLIAHSSVVTDAPETLSYHISLFGPIGADGRQGMRKSLAQLRDVGASSTAMIAGQMVFLEGLVLVGVLVLGQGSKLGGRTPPAIPKVSGVSVLGCLIYLQ